MKVKSILWAGLLLALACNFLLSPPRPFDALSTPGKVSILFFWLTDGLNVAGLVKFYRGQTHAAARLFGIGMFTILAPEVVDQAGWFAPTISAPTRITGLEIVWPVLQLTLFGVASRHARHSGSQSPSAAPP